MTATGQVPIEKQSVIALIREAFSGTAHPGDDFLLGSREGREAFETVEAFKGVTSWDEIDPEMLDANYTALSFLSEGGFRFFLPAYLIADLNDQLLTADVVFHLGGVRDIEIQLPVGDRVFEKRIGPSVLLNPRRYGAMTHGDYLRYRLSVFAREEAAAIVAYLEFKRALPDAPDTAEIDSALDSFWRARADEAPTQAELAEQLKAENEYLAALGVDMGSTDPG